MQRFFKTILDFIPDHFIKKFELFLPANAFEKFFKQIRKFYEFALPSNQV